MTGPRRTPPTLADVAERAGVSAQTVSNYLTGRNKPRGDNLRRIEEAIRELDYHPSAAARALRVRRSNILGMLLEDPEHAGGDAVGMGLREPLHTLFLHGAATKAREQGFYITTVLTWRGETETHASRLVRAGRADGLICSTEAMTTARLRKLQEIARAEHVPIALLQERAQVPEIYTVSAQDEVGAEQALEHLARFGHRRLAVVGVAPLWPGPMRRTAAFVKAAQRAGLHVEEWLAEKYVIDAVRARVAPELRRPDRPTGLFAVNDIVAMAVIQQANELGLNVPGDCSVIGFNDLDIASYFRPAITTVRLPAAAMGARAVEILIKAIRGDGAAESASLEVEFVARMSTGPAPDRTIRRRMGKC